MALIRECPAAAPVAAACLLVFLAAWSAAASPADPFPVTIRVDAAKPLGELKPIWRFFGADEPNYAYMRHGEKLLRELGALAPKRVYFRAHNLLTSGDGTPALKWGSTGVYREEADGRPVYRWDLLDRIFDTYLERGVRPYAQIGFMPEALSIKPQPYQHRWTPQAAYDEIYTGWAYPPKDYGRWAELVYQWVRHSVERYGRAEVESWYWEVWNEPNIGYWRGTPAEFHRLHDYAIDAVRRALPTARVGGPDVAGSGGRFMRDFLNHCLSGTNHATGSIGTPLDFVSFHAKGAPRTIDGHVRMGIADHLRVIDDGFRLVVSYPELKGKPIVIGESDPEGCAACQGPALAYRNGTMYSSYTAASFARIHELAARHGVNLEGALTWAFEFEDQPYFAGFRSLASHGLDKPVLNVFRMFARMAGPRLQVESDAARPLEDLLRRGVRDEPDVAALACGDSNQLQVLVWHYHDDDVPGPPAAVDLSVTGWGAADREVAVQHFRIDEDHSNAFSAWRRLGLPQNPSPEQYAALEQAGQLASLGPAETARAEDGTLRLSFRLPRQAVSLLVLEPAGTRTADAGGSSRELVVTNHLALDPGARLSARLVVRASHLTIDGRGATLVGPGRAGDAPSLESAGIGLLIEGASDVTVRNLKVRGFATGLVIRDARAVSVADCDFSDNYHNPAHGWGELPARGGILVERSRWCVFRHNRANRVWDGIHLVDADDNLVADNDFSECSNTCAKLWHSCRNRFLNNNLSYGIRIDRAAGEVHARDSTCVLIETGSDDNTWVGNDITHGGDGVFIRPLNRWVSRGNVFIENDTSHANNNCVESWSPGNTFIRNKANHGSYGFWLGGSDHTVLIGNEAAFNGLTNGYHNAPESGFGHGGIVIVGGPASHTLIEGNHLHHNNGAGLAFRGDVASGGRRWRTEHWLVQQNLIQSNRFGIWGRWGDAILLAANTLTDNTEGNALTNVTHLEALAPTAPLRLAPTAVITGPELLQVGETGRFDGSLSHDPSGESLTFQWWLHGSVGAQPRLERVFAEPGFYRLGLTVHNVSLAGLAWRDLLVVRPVAREWGTEGQAAQWGFELEGDAEGRGRVRFEDDAEGIVGRRCLRFAADPYPGAYASVIYPASRDARWDLAGRKRIAFWIKTLNPNIPGWQNPGPVVRLHARDGQLEFKPAKDANLLNDPPFSEARWLWMPVTIPLAGDDAWQRTVTGSVALERIDALSLSLDSWGGEPFTVWLDGLTVE